MSDLISRQAAIDAAMEEFDNGTFFDIPSKIEALSSAQTERKTGLWRLRLVDCGFDADWHCSRCGWKTSLEVHGYNYCPNCGADMRGEKDEQE